MREYKFGINAFVITFTILFISISISFIARNYIESPTSFNNVGGGFLIFIFIIGLLAIIYFVVALFYRLLNINQKIIVYDDYVLAPKSMPCFATPSKIKIDDIYECLFVVNKINYITKSELFIKTKNKTYYYNEAYLKREVAEKLAEDINKMISERKNKNVKKPSLNNFLPES